MNLPDLNKYHSSFILDGTQLPLTPTPVNANGLLILLPRPATGKIGWPWTEETNPTIYTPGINWPKLTIVTPSYNQGEFIEQTIRSVLLQNYPNLEYIIIDGGSSDNTMQVLEKYSPWISFWQSKKDNGQSQAINLGFSLASGAYYAWINSDDYYLKDVLSAVVNKFLRAKTCVIYGYGYNYDTTSQLFELVKTYPLYDYFIRIPSLIQPSCFWDAKIHKPVWEELNCSLDYELWLRMIKGNKRKLLKIPLSVANVHDKAKTSNPGMKAAWEADHQLICSVDAHGPVNDWDKRVFIHNVFKRINKLFIR